MKGSVIAAAGLLLVVGAVSAGVGTGVFATPWTAAAGSPSASPSAGAGTEVRTAVVERLSMQTSAELNGALGYEGSLAVTTGATGTLTRLPQPGTILERGDVLYEIDGKVRPRLLYGDRPLWRPLVPGMSDGADVLQLEQNLRAMGYAPRGLKVNRHWDDRTTKAVKRWQRAIGHKRDGTLDGSDVAFLAGAIRVSAQSATVGASVGPGATVLDATTATRVITLDLSASRQDLVARGQAVTIDLPGDVTVGGTVREVGRVATASQDGSVTTVPVTIDVDDASKLPDLDAAPATVRVVTEERAGVLAVPVNALIALLEGGYAVEKIADDGSRRYVGVRIGLFEKGMVEVSGDGLQAGDRVVTAR